MCHIGSYSFTQTLSQIIGRFLDIHTPDFWEMELFTSILFHSCQAKWLLLFIVSIPDIQCLVVVITTGFYGFHSFSCPSSLYVAIRFWCGWCAIPITSFSWICNWIHSMFTDNEPSHYCTVRHVRHFISFFYFI